MWNVNNICHFKNNYEDMGLIKGDQLYNVCMKFILKSYNFKFDDIYSINSNHSYLRFRPSKFGMADHIAVAVHLSPILGAGTKYRGNCGQTDKVVTNYNLYVIFKRS